MSLLITKQGEVISRETRSLISTRYKAITKAVNREFWNSTSDTLHSMYVGSYGRGTAIDTSDIDILVELPRGEYERYTGYKGNGQSRLLQAVKNAIITTYPRTDISADGQVVIIKFTDGMKMEVLPAFAVVDWNGKTSYQYPNTNMGGNWQSTNPKAEQKAIKEKNLSSNGLLLDTCKHFRFIRDNYFHSYHLSGIVIDSFAYLAIEAWRWTENSNYDDVSDGRYEEHLSDYFSKNCKYSRTLQAPGSGQTVDLTKSIECLEKVIDKMAR